MPRTRPASADLVRLARTYGGPLVTAIVLLAFYAGGSSFWIYNLTLVATYAIVVVGLNVFVGYLGLVTFAQTSFMAIGGDTPPPPPPRPAAGARGAGFVGGPLPPVP